jgi:hypothetical protein
MPMTKNSRTFCRRRLLISRSIYLVMLFCAKTVGAQDLIATSNSFDYFRCSHMLQEPDIIGAFDGVKLAVEMYNDQPNVDVRMQMPDPTICYVGVGKEGSFFAGIPFFRFYISEEHFQCSINGNCTGDLRGYDAGLILGSNGIQFSVNTDRSDDYIYLCFKDGKMNLDRC